MPRYKEKDRDTIHSTTRQQLMQAAIQIIARDGFENANINQISITAGFAKGTIYNYFSSKDALILALIAEYGGQHVAYIASAVRLEHAPDARLRRFFQAGFRYINEQPAAAQMLLSALYSNRIEFREALGAAYQPMFQMVGEEILTEGSAQGMFRPVDIPATTVLILTLYLGAGSQRDLNLKTYQDPDIVAEFALQSLINRR